MSECRYDAAMRSKRGILWTPSEQAAGLFSHGEKGLGIAGTSPGSGSMGEVSAHLFGSE